jgi:hypothetical protein
MVSETQFCIFCGGQPTTREHIFSRWTHDFMAPRSPGKTIGLRGFHYATGDDLWNVKMAGALRDWKVKCVCGGGKTSCNNGWMRERIDEAAMPTMSKLFRAEQFRLYSKDQERVAAWAVLKAIVAEYDDGDHVTTHHMQRKYLMRHFKPPKQNWAVWIGHYERRAWKPEWISGALFGAPTGWPVAKLNDPPTYFNGHTVTQVIDKLFIQVLSLPIPGFVEGWRFAMPDGGHLFRIWPPVWHSIKWPGAAMSDREADLTASALDRAGRREARRRLGLPHEAALTDGRTPEKRAIT